jgi:hypothetical protein
MAIDLHEIKLKGKKIRVPATRINNWTVVVTGRRIRMAAVHGEEWNEGQVVDDPDSFVEQLKERKMNADIFTFAQKIPDTKPRYKYFMEWDNVAAIPIMSFQDWLDGVSTDMRKDLKRAASRGVITKAVEFDDNLVKGIMEINNDTPTRQGRYFVHYGKDFETVKSDYASYLERSEFIAAYYEGELIGLIKMIYVGELACLMQIFSKTKHYDKSPTNALIAKAVEICEKKGKSYLTYGKLYYGNKVKSSLVAFKLRNGFEPIFYPRYYIPLNLKGRISLKLRLHRGLLGILPGNLVTLLLNLRSFYEQKSVSRVKLPRRSDPPGKDEDMKDEQAKARSDSV